jgi:excisionase family DNA binding protein
MQNEAKRTLSVLEANKATCIGQTTIRTAIKNGELPAIKLGERRIRILPESLDLWLRNLEASSKETN